ncbi:MAG: Cro/CI family transcriptional regulator [Parahaliea sp.]
MKMADVIEYFGSQGAVALVLGTSPQNISMMVKKDQIPKGRQYELQVKSGGVLVASTFDPAMDYADFARRSIQRASRQTGRCDSALVVQETER